MNNILIYGAGTLGVNVLESIKTKNNNIIGFIDNDESKKDLNIEGIKVFSITELEKLIKEHKINSIYIAISEMPKNVLETFTSKLKGYDISCYSIPSIEELIRNYDFNEGIQFKEISHNNISDIEKNIQDLSVPMFSSHSILVTGAGGSIGSEITRQLYKNNPSEMILVDSCEYNLFRIKKEIKDIQKINVSLKTVIHYKLGDLSNKNFVKRLFKEHKPSYIYHAAAYKHVGLLEKNIFVGFRNNILSTYNLLINALITKASLFIQISTDKAVKPSSIMGLSKRVCEIMVSYMLEKQSDLKYSIVRFGNVIGSSGSVIPIFREQIQRGGPVTVTHKDATRYFMSIYEASQLVIWTSLNIEKNATYLLDMGEPINIYEIAKKMILLADLAIKNSENPNGDIEIKIIGLSDGEKLHEELHHGESKRLKKQKKIFLVNDSKNFEISQKKLDLIINACKSWDEDFIVDFSSKYTK